MRITTFLKSRIFLKNLAIALVAVVALLWIVMGGINLYTRHGDKIQVPMFTGLHATQLSAHDQAADFEFIIIDSIYDEKFHKGEVVLQNPYPGATVKRGRKIYVTIVATAPEMVKMPDLRDLSLRQALNQLRIAGLQAGILTYETNFARNAVLDQQLNDITITPGTEVTIGTQIDLTLGTGLNNEKTKVPLLLGMTLQQASEAILNASLNMGRIKYYDGSSSDSMRVYAQKPDWQEAEWADMGTPVELWLRSEVSYDFDSLLQSVNNPPEVIDEIINQEIEEPTE
jgi:beta-lactam-binding protein with PASTA domain